MFLIYIAKYDSRGYYNSKACKLRGDKNVSKIKGFSVLGNIQQIER
jgi:hypothetical protein